MDPLNVLAKFEMRSFSQGSSERVRYFAERVLNVRSDQQIKNAFVSLYDGLCELVKRLLVVKIYVNV